MPKKNSTVTDKKTQTPQKIASKNTLKKVKEEVNEKVDNKVEEIDLKETEVEEKALIDEPIKDDTEKKEENKVIKEEGSKYDTISLKEIREALGNRVDSKQKKSVIKDNLINLGFAIAMVLHLILVMLGVKNITPETLDKDMRIITLFILLIGIVMLEISYKKDSLKTAMHGIEVLVFGAANLCLIYIAKLYHSNLIRFLGYIGLVVAGYYIIKSTIISFRDIKKFKKENNDIKDIVQKKNNIEF